MNAVLKCGCAATIVMATLCVPSTQVSAADDAGIGAFFREAFGIASSPQPAPYYGLPDDHAIVVHRKRTRTVTRRPDAKIAVGPVAPVSIYEDRTLRAGDAVMTKTGVRVFLGGHGAPYSEADFAALADAEGLPRQVEKELVVINKGPHG